MRTAGNRTRGARGGSAPAANMTDAVASVLREQGAPKSVDYRWRLGTAL